MQHKNRLYYLLILICSLLVLIYLLPLPTPLISSPYATTLLDENDKLLGAQVAKDEQWRFKSHEQLNSKYILAVINFEDKRFFSHFGVDIQALLRALYLDIKYWKVVSGGSTITMQLARIANGNQPRNLWQKIKEIFMSIKIEMLYSKLEILKMYADNAPFGGNTVGISAASWRYFSRTTEQLSWAEAALLAVLPNAPSLIHLSRSRIVLKKKRDKLLKRLYDRNLLGKLDYTLSILEPLPEKPEKIPSIAPLLMGSLKKKYPTLNIIHSTLNKELQEQIQLIAQFHSQRIANTGIHNLSIMVVENSSMEIKAYIGNKAYLNKKIYASQLDIMNRPRSTGSTLKPLLFATAIDSGYITPNTLISDVPSYYYGFIPTNYDGKYRGMVTAKDALIKSLNVPTVKILYGYGYKRFYNDLKKYGMHTLYRSADEYGLSLILGGAETTLKDLVNIYANISSIAEGIHSKKFLKLQIIENQHQKFMGDSPISQGAAFITLNTIKKLKRPGIDGKLLNIINLNQVAWKTGTSYGLRDAWAIGTTPKYTVGIWAGNATGEGSSDLSGTKTAAPILFDIFRLLKYTKWYKTPTVALKTINVCIEDGFLATDECKSIKIDMPINSNFQKTSPYRKTIHLDKNTSSRVHSGCENVNNMIEKHFFYLPPDEAYYYQQNNSNYKNIPKFREDCKLGIQENKSVIEINYPKKGHSIYLPKNLNGIFGEVTLKARHAIDNHKLYWHIDNKYIGTTVAIHDMTLFIKPGEHIVLVMDPEGNRVSRKFKVLSRDGTF